MLLFAIAANADNLIVAAAYRLRGVVITWRANGVISLITGFCTGLAMLMASSVVQWWLSERMAAFIGAVLLVGTGLWFIASGEKNGHQLRYRLYRRWYLRKQGNPQWELLLLALLLSINNLAGGIGAGMTGISPIGTAVMVSVGSMLSIALGQHLAAKPWLKRWEKYLSWVAGGLLIVLGVYALASHW